MDPINIFVAFNIFLLFFANIGGAKKGVRAAVGAVRLKSKSRLQKLPYLSALILVVIIVSLFGIGTLPYNSGNQSARLIALVLYIAASWMQIGTMRALGESYSQEMVILKNHALVKSGWYSRLRHPHYLGQIIADTAACAAVLSYVAAPLVIAQIPLLILRARAEEDMLEKQFGPEFIDYKSKSSFIIPFLW